MDRLDRTDLQDAAFDVALRGYDKRQVDERIRFLAAELGAAEHALRAAQARAAMLEDEVHQVRSGSNGTGPTSGPGGSGLENSFGARVEKILMMAEEEAREIRGQASGEATAMVDQARAEAEEQHRRIGQEIAARQAEAEKVGTTAAQEAAQLRQSAAHEADKLRQAAAQEADEVRKGARAQAAQLVEQARMEADRLVGSATESAQQRERSSGHELQRLSRLRDQVNAELYRAKSVLDGFFPTAPKGSGDQEAAHQDGQSNASMRRGPRLADNGDGPR
ncbi:MAG: hypothetical protein ACRDSP_07515 [Pseudonocardiaceae bacterium]